MNDAQRIILWSGVIALGLVILVWGPRPHFFMPSPTSDTAASAASAATNAEMPEHLDSGYFEVIAGCGPYFEGECLNVRTGPSTDFPAVVKLRKGVVLKFDGSVDTDGRTWYRLSFDEWLRYPERVRTDMYVASEYVRAFTDEGPREVPIGTSASSTKYILIDRSEQKLYAYDGEDLFMDLAISTGIELTPTPRGVFHVYKKTPSRYMQGPIPGISEKVFDLPGVPWNLYFTAEGAVIHGAYWHDKFGQPWSNGCVNMPPEKAAELYRWAELGTKVIVRD